MTLAGAERIRLSSVIRNQHPLPNDANDAHNLLTNSAICYKACFAAAAISRHDSAAHDVRLCYDGSQHKLQGNLGRSSQDCSWPSKRLRKLVAKSRSDS